MVHVASWHQIGDKALLSEALGVLASRIPRDRVRVALVGDGADWIGDVMLRHFPDGEEICAIYNGTFTQIFAHYMAAQAVRDSSS